MKKAIKNFLILVASMSLVLCCPEGGKWDIIFSIGCVVVMCIASHLLVNFEKEEEQI